MQAMRATTCIILPLLAATMLTAGCGTGTDSPKDQGSAPSPQQQPSQVPQKPAQNNAAGNEPKIFVNGSAVKKKIDNFNFTSDMRTMLFEEVKGGAFVIYETTLSDGQWSTPVTPSFSQTTVSVGAPFLNKDANKVYFHSFRALAADLSTPSSSLDLWVVERNDKGWGEPKLAGIPKTKAEDFHYYPSVSDKGTVYFTSFRADSKGKDDIYRSRLINGVYGEPEHLGAEINTGDIDAYPHISGDESTLLFGRSSDLFVSYNRDGRWTEAKALGLNQYGIRKLRSPVLSKDHKLLYFVGEKDGTSHIYQTSFPRP